MEKRVNRIIDQSSDKCEFFHIGKDNNWYITRGMGCKIPLYQWNRESLLDLFISIQEEVYSYKTNLNIKTISNELNLYKL